MASLRWKLCAICFVWMKYWTEPSVTFTSTNGNDNITFDDIKCVNGNMADCHGVRFIFAKGRTLNVGTTQSHTIKKETRAPKKCCGQNHCSLCATVSFNILCSVCVYMQV